MGQETADWDDAGGPLRGKLTAAAAFLGDFWRRADGAVRSRFARRLWVFLTVFVVTTPLLVMLVFAVIPPLTTPLMLMRAAEGYPITRDWTPLSRISPHVAQAVIAAEDNRFCAHQGIDWPAFGTVAARTLKGEKTPGASTLTMQTVKNLVLWPQRSYVRKALEVPLSLQLDLLWPKERILEVYLNIVEWGPGIYGVEAAARHYFGKPADQLTRWEAARLAAVLPNPLAMTPVGGDYVSRQAQIIARRVDQLGPLLACAPR